MALIVQKTINSRTSIRHETKIVQTLYFWPRIVQYLPMVILATQFGIQPILTRKFGSPLIAKESVVAVCEIFKMLIGVILFLLLDENPRATMKAWTIGSSIKAALVPGTIYASQNLLIQMSYRNLDGLVFNLINQTKLLFSAIFIYKLMGRGQSRQQIFALFLVSTATFLLSLGERSESRATNSFLYGIIPALLASILSGISTAWSQKVLQIYNRNPFVYSIELAVFSLFSLPGISLLTGDGLAIMERGLFFGWSWSNIIPVIVNAAGGIAAGQVTKYVGGVRKGFSLIAGVLLTGILQSLLWGVSLTLEMWISLPMVILSMYIYSAYPYQEEKITLPNNKEE